MATGLCIPGHWRFLQWLRISPIWKWHLLFYSWICQGVDHVTSFGQYYWQMWYKHETEQYATGLALTCCQWELIHHHMNDPEQAWLRWETHSGHTKWHRPAAMFLDYLVPIKSQPPADENWYFKPQSCETVCNKGNGWGGLAPKWLNPHTNFCSLEKAKIS